MDQLFSIIFINRRYNIYSFYERPSKLCYYLLLILVLLFSFPFSSLLGCLRADDLLFIRVFWSSCMSVATPSQYHYWIYCFYQFLPSCPILPPPTPLFFSFLKIVKSKMKLILEHNILSIN